MTAQDHFVDAPLCPCYRRSPSKGSWRVATREQVVGLFPREESAVEAATLLRSAGYGPRDLDLVSIDAGRQPDLPDLPDLLSRVRLGRLMERPEGMWPAALRWGLLGSLVVEVGVLIWVLLTFDSWAIQVFLASTCWKLGAMFGGMLGAIVGADAGLESQAVRRYEKHFAVGAIALAARVRGPDRMMTRGAFIESGAFDVRSVEGRFIAKKARPNDGVPAQSQSPQSAGRRS